MANERLSSINREQETDRLPKNRQQIDFGNEENPSFGEQLDQPFIWRQKLSRDGQSLYRILLREIGDTDLLTYFAQEHHFDLDLSLAELRFHNLLDESDPQRLKLRL